MVPEGHAVFIDECQGRAPPFALLSRECLIQKSLAFETGISCVAFEGQPGSP